MFQEKSSATFHRVVTLRGMARHLLAMVAAALLVLPTWAAEKEISKILDRTLQ
jgi:hypothetical protein